jgi:hypothetical protein
MKKEIIQGIPFWVDAQNRIFAFEGKEVPTNPLWLGTYNSTAKTLDLRPDWQTAYDEKLNEYRRSTAPRPRVPQASS